MRIVSMVPSWTETLVEAGLDVVGRTRFCVHPARAQPLPIVGGTKDIDWEKVKALKPDLLLLDKEENPKQFATESPVPVLATHVQDLASAAREMARLAQEFKSPRLHSWTQEWQELRQDHKWTWDQIPGEIERLPQPGPHQKVVYVIWKKPWMVANKNTFIGSTLQFLGADMADLGTEEKYPKVQEEFLKKHHVLFSSEPFPFVKKKADLIKAGFGGSLVDGESFSWFGVRSLRFLKSLPTDGSLRPGPA